MKTARHPTEDEQRADYWRGEVSKIAHSIAMTMGANVESTIAATAALDRAKAIVRICYGVEDLDEMYEKGKR